MRIENDFDNRFTTDSILFMVVPCNLPTKISPNVSFRQNENTPMQNCIAKYIFSRSRKITRRKMCQQMQLWVVENCCWGPISAAGARHLPLGHSMRGEGRFLIFSKYFYLHLFIFNFSHFPLVTLLNFVQIVTWISPNCSMDFSKLIHEFL